MRARVNPGTDENVTFPILPASVKIAVGNLAAARARSIYPLTSGVREAKKRVERKLEEDLVNRLDQTAALLKTNGTEIIRTACLTYLKSMRTNRERC
ncbi:MAG: hypothetical protein WBV70_04650 [Candidatus Bathyarchaeia archaeon]